MILRDLTVPGLKEARLVQEEIKRLGIKDVELFFDPELGVWGVCQVRQQDSNILVMNDLHKSKVEKYLMWWCTNNEGKYRHPSAKDVHDVVATVRRAQEWFKKGGDKLADELDAQDQLKREKKEQALKERLAPHVKELKKAIRSEMG